MLVYRGRPIRVGGAVCPSCNTDAWTPSACKGCEKRVRVCENAGAHTSEDPGWFFVEHPGQSLCSPDCGSNTVDIKFQGLTVEFTFDPATTTPRQVIESLVENAQSILVPPPDGPVDVAFLVHPPLRPLAVAISNRALLEQSDPDASLSSIFRPPCSDMMVRDYLKSCREGAHKDAALSEDGKTPLAMDKLLSLQLTTRQLEVITHVPRPLEETLMEWFHKRGIEDMTEPKAKKDLPFVRGKDGVAVRSLYGKTYYDQFLAPLRARRPDLVSPFYDKSGWVFFSRLSTEWTDHYTRVADACPPRSYAPLKYLMTRELMECDEQYRAFIEEDAEIGPYYEDLVRTYGMLEACDFAPPEGFTFGKMPKKKASKKRKDPQEKGRAPPEQSKKQKEGAAPPQESKKRKEDKKEETPPEESKKRKEGAAPPSRLVFTVSREMIAQNSDNQRSSDPYAVPELKMEELLG